MDENEIQDFIKNYLETMKGLGATDETINTLQQSHKILHSKSKQTIITPGEICKNIYLVVNGGFVCRFVHQKTGIAKTINFYLEDLHPVMACLDSYFLQTPTNCELRAISESTVLSLPKTIVDTIRNNDPAYRQYYDMILNAAMTGENELKANLLTFSAKEKYEYVLNEMPSVIHKVPSKYIAEFCGISAEWLSKLKKQY